MHTALRELALLWVADRVEEGLLRYRAEHGIGQTWEARERVVVALTGGPEGATLIRRAARIASRTVGGDLLAVHVVRSDGLTGASPAALATQRRLAESLGGSYHQVIGDDISEALLAFARAENRHPAGAGREPPLLAGHDADRSRHSGQDHPGIRRHRRAHRHPRRDGTPQRAAAAEPQHQLEPPDLRVRAGRPPGARSLPSPWPARAAGSTCFSDALVFLVAVRAGGALVRRHPALLAAVRRLAAARSSSSAACTWFTHPAAGTTCSTGWVVFVALAG